MAAFLLLLLQRRAEAKTIYGRYHLLDGDLGGVEGHHRLLRLEAHICPIHQATRPAVRAASLMVSSYTSAVNAPNSNVSR
jgi:hypothetical protein